MSEPHIVATQRFAKALDRVVGTQAASACVVTVARLVVDLEERGAPAPERAVVEREPDVFALPFEGGEVIYELGAEHRRTVPFVIVETIELQR